MDNIRNIYRRVTLVMVAFLFIISSGVYIYFIAHTADVYEKQAVESVIDVKKDFLKNIIHNLIIEIDFTEEKEKEHYEQWTTQASQVLREYYRADPDHFIDPFIEFCNVESNKKVLSVVIRDKNTAQIIYKSGSFIEANPQKGDFSSYFMEDYGDYSIFFGVSNQYIEEVTKALIVGRIRSREFSENSYVWINEIKDYDGGDDYAIRIVEPNFPENEGDYLSSNVRDEVGDYPYAAELEGLKKDGQIFFSYHLKSEKNNEISEKVAYARLYEKYDWVMAIGVHLDELEEYMASSQQEQNKMFKKIVRNTLLLMISIFIFYWLFMSRIEKWYYRKYNTKLKDVYIDPLTQAQNRRAGHIYLETAFRDFKMTDQTPMIMMIDIDDFKRVNDSYGHFEGDRVLKNIVRLIHQHIRGTDLLYRWGGEEFLLVCDGLKEDDVIIFANKLITIVGSQEYEYEGERYKATISMGIAKFEPLDKTYEDGVDRADRAMYRAKSKGKNRACTWKECGLNPLDN